MTLLERIHSADVTELADFLCALQDPHCAGCPAEGCCTADHNGFLDVLRQEVRDDLEISYLVE